MSNDVFVNIETLGGEISDDSFGLLAAGRLLARGLGGKLVATVLGHDCDELCARLGAADEVRCVDHLELAEFNPEAHLRTLCGLLQADPPRVLLLGQDTMGTDLACGIALELGASVVSSCREVSVVDGKLGFECLTCGGKILADGEMPGPVSVVLLMPGGYAPQDGRVDGAPTIERLDPPVELDALRTEVLETIPPEGGDVDIGKEEVLVSVGRGLKQQENLQLAEHLAEALGGVVSGSRPVVDQGWLPASRLIGKSGHKVHPKLYIALGISGSPEHLEGVPDCETLVAINTDEKAPIFEVATLGSTVDALELLPVLTEKLATAGVS